jgi:hypothetical protein
MKLAVTLLSATCLILADQPAFSEDADCSLSVENAQLCFARDKYSRECLWLHTKMHENVEQFRCLVRSFSSIEGCKGVTIAQNAFVLLRPLAIRYEGILFPKISKEFYNEERIQSSCRTR